MINMFGGVKTYVKLKPKVDVPRADTRVFRLHYRVTFSILLVSCILVSAYAYIDSSGSAIQCMLDKGSPIPAPVINRYCWISSTFTLPTYYEGKAGKDFLHYGVGAHGEDEEVVYHAYYQWVPLMLFFQALCFYAPHWIWKQLEGDRLKNILAGLNKRMTEEKKVSEVNDLVIYLKERQKYTWEHKSWAIKFFVCESFNFINVIGQIFLTDLFLGGEFTAYGIEVIRFATMEPEDRVDPMSKVFPRMTKCTFHKYGGSGTIQRFDALCVLGMNILNEKIYIFLWFWFIILAFITGCSLVVRIVQKFVPSTRQRFVRMETSKFGFDQGLRVHLQEVIEPLYYSDWLILYFLEQIMERENFRALVENLHDKLEDDKERDRIQGRKRQSDEESLLGHDSPDATLRRTEKFPMTVMNKVRKSLS